MKITLLRHRKIGEPSCSKLQRALRARGIELNKTDNFDESDPDILIRWGHIGYFPLKAGSIELNTAVSIYLGVNKRAARKNMAGLGIPCPKTYFRKCDAQLCDGGLIGRRSHHTQGKGATVIHNVDELRDDLHSTYWSQIIHKTREVRCYVFGGSVIGVVEKFPQDPSAILWNRHQGARFEDVSRDAVSAEVQMIAVHAAMRFGQYFSAVDIILDGDVPYVLELNTSIGLSNPHRVEIFAKAFERVIKHYEQTGELL